MNNLDLLNSSVKRLLSFVDSNKYSKTYGCFDRDFWHYKTLCDFPSATYQQGVLTLALVYQNEFSGNEFYRNDKILDLIGAGINYWCSMENHDGSFNEWFPNEHSHVATAFTAYAITESILRLKDELKLSPGVFKKIKKAGDWLCDNPDYLVTNHAAGALMALYNIYLLTNEDKYLKGVKKQLSVISKNQNNEGWFLEYDGCDPGYLSVTVDFLARYYLKSKDEKTLPVLEKAVKFMNYFAHPDGTYGGEYGSRNTKYLFTCGLVGISGILPQARSILERCLWRVESDILSVVDDRYLIFFFLPNYLETFANTQKKNFELYKDDDSILGFEKNFPEAGIYVKKNDKYHLIINYKKGGIIKIFSVKDKKITYGDTGYVVKIKAKKDFLYSQNLKGNTYSKIKKSGDITEIFLEQKFSFWKESHPFKKYIIPFRFFNYTCGYSSVIMAVFNRWMKKRMILDEKLSDIKLRRKFEMGENSVKISDEIVNDSGAKILSQSKINDISFRHVPSSRFFRINDFSFSPPKSNIAEINF